MEYLTNIENSELLTKSVEIYSSLDERRSGKEQSKSEPVRITLGKGKKRK